MIFFFAVRPPNVLQGMIFFMPNDFWPKFMPYFHALGALGGHGAFRSPMYFVWETRVLSRSAETHLFQVYSSADAQTRKRKRAPV